MGQKIIKDDIKSLKHKQKDLENRIALAKRETENCLNSLLKSKRSAEKQENSAALNGEAQATSDALESTQGSTAEGKSEGDWDINKVSACDCAS